MKLAAYIKEQLPTEQTAAELLSGYVADERNWRAIPSIELIPWGAAAGRLEKIEDAIATGPAGIRSMARSAYLMLTRGDATLNIRLPDRAAMLAALIAAEVLTAADQQSLQALAWIGDGSTPDALTEANVTAAIATEQRRTAANAATLASQAAYDLARQINEASIDDADLSPVTLEQAVPDGYSNVNGTLSKDA